MEVNLGQTFWPECWAKNFGQTLLALERLLYGNAHSVRGFSFYFMMYLVLRKSSHSSMSFAMLCKEK